MYDFNLKNLSTKHVNLRIQVQWHQNKQAKDKTDGNIQN